MAIKNWFLLSLLLTSIVASPVQRRSSPVKLNVNVNFNTISTGETFIDKDLGRSKARFDVTLPRAQENGQKQVSLSALDAGIMYIATVGVGAGTYFLLVDPGSSNTWIGANQTYQPGPNSHDTGQTVTVYYGSGNFTGEEYTEDVTIGSATISGQSIGVASSATYLDNADGILGIGPTDLTNGTTSGGGTFPTVTDNLLSQGDIDTALVGMSFIPTTSLGDVNGELDFGAPDYSNLTSEFTKIPITSTSPASYYWGIDQSITYGSSGTPILSKTAGIVDGGTTLLLLATDAYKTYVNVTGATYDKDTGFLTVPDRSTLESMYFNIGGTTLEFTANAQIWPSSLNTWINGTSSQTYLIVGDLGTPSGSGLDFINGFVFLQRFYSVYDTTDSQVWLATTSHTLDTSN